MRWKYDAIEGTFEQHEQGASGKLSNVWQKNIHGVSDLPEACLFQEELFGVEKSQFKKANAAEVRKNKIHMKKWMTKYEEDIGDMD